MADKKPSFEERCRALAEAGDDLKRITDIVTREAILMAAAQERFAARDEGRTKKTSR